VIYFLVTVFEREASTMNLLEQISRVCVGYDWHIVVNDNSVNAEYKELRKLHNVSYFKTSGLYWNQGMIAAYQYMLKKFKVNTNDYIICLNNDIELNLDFQIGEIAKHRVYVGNFCDRMGVFSYGLRTGRSKLFPLAFSDNGSGLNTFNMNFVAFRFDVLAKLEFLDEKFSHGFGDYDLGFRVSRANIKISSSKNFIGVCERNGDENTSLDRNFSKLERLRMFHSIKECPPAEHIHFLKKNGGTFWPVFYLYRYVRVFR
jgi:GT2 family glycosyltransferase